MGVAPMCPSGKAGEVFSDQLQGKLSANSVERVGEIEFEQTLFAVAGVLLGPSAAGVDSGVEAQGASDSDLERREESLCLIFHGSAKAFAR